jgi:hypothetical protein
METCRPLASSLPPRVFGSAQRAVPGAADQETTADLLRAADRVLNASKQEDETAGVAGLAYPA